MVSNLDYFCSKIVIRLLLKKKLWFSEKKKVEKIIRNIDKKKQKMCFKNHKILILLFYSNRIIRRDSMWTLSNIAAGPKHQREQLYASNALDTICELSKCLYFYQFQFSIFISMKVYM